MRSGRQKPNRCAPVSIPDTLLMPQLLRKVPRPPACSICVRDDIWKVVGATLTSFFERSALKVNPVLLARKVLGESPHVYFVAEGAERFAQDHGIPLCKMRI